LHVMGYLYIYVIARKTSMCARASIYHLAGREETRPSTNAERVHFAGHGISEISRYRLSLYRRSFAALSPSLLFPPHQRYRSLALSDETRMILSYRRLTHNGRFLSSKERNLSILVRISQIRMVRKRKQ